MVNWGGMEGVIQPVRIQQPNQACVRPIAAVLFPGHRLFEALPEGPGVLASSQPQARSLDQAGGFGGGRATQTGPFLEVTSHGLSP
jgi:hypothetical protein